MDSKRTIFYGMASKTVSATNVASSVSTYLTCEFVFASLTRRYATINLFFFFSYKRITSKIRKVNFFVFPRGLTKYVHRPLVAANVNIKFSWTTVFEVRTLWSIVSNDRVAIFCSHRTILEFSSWVSVQSVAMRFSKSLYPRCS
jgi:hypothetical protein